MYKGVTPTLIFQFSEDAELDRAREIIVSFTNNKGRTILDLTDVTVEDNSITVELTQEQTLKMPDYARVQINWTFIGGKRACSVIKQISFRDNLYPEVIA